VTTPSQLREAITVAVNETRPVVINVMIEPSGQKKLVSASASRGLIAEFWMDVRWQGERVEAVTNLVIRIGSK
jgi:hypothetical protein